MPEPDDFFTGGDKKVSGVRVLFLTFMVLLFVLGGFGLGYMAARGF